MIDNLNDALKYYKDAVRNERASRGCPEVNEQWRQVRYAIFTTLNLLGFGDAAMEARREIDENE